MGVGKISRRLVKGLWIILPVAGAILAVAYLVAHRPGPTQKKGGETVRTVRIIEAPSVNLVPRAVGYGVAEPGSVWEAVAEVKGTVAFVHPRLKSGEWITGTSVVVRIDSTEYDLAIARLEAGYEETRARIRELAQEEDNTRRLIAIERRSLGLVQKSLDRKRDALKRRVISQDEVDREEKIFLQQKQNLLRMENTLALIPSKRNALNAALAAHRADLEQARIELTKTIITAPFDCRIGDVSVEPGQFVRAGQSLFTAQGTAVTEVEARFRLEEMRNLLSEPMRRRLGPGLNTGTFERIFHDVRVLVRLQSGEWPTEWEARIDRVREEVDVTTREIRVVAAVDRPYDKAEPAVRPPLTPGMFCRVELQAPARAGSVVVPRSALHDNHVFIIDPEQRLQKRLVVVDFAQDDLVVIRSGLSGGERVVVSDPRPAIIGMRVSPVPDHDVQERLVASSRGERATE